MFIFAGTIDHKKELSIDCWVHCYTNYACKAPNFYPEEFDQAAVVILQQDLNIQKCDINISNARIVYLHLVNVLSTV